MNVVPEWLSLTRHDAPLIVSMPHAGTRIPPAYGPHFASEWLALKDTDWWIENLYDFAQDVGATVIRTMISRSVIDVNRDPSGRSLYPGQNTTELCPITTFDGEQLYCNGKAPDPREVASRLRDYFEPYHKALRSEIARLRSRHAKIVLFEAHSIRSRIPHLFDGELPHFNIGTNSGAACALELTAAIGRVFDSHAFSRVTNGRFKGGWTARHYGDPARGIHAVQLELAMRAYMNEPDVPTRENWPARYDSERAAPMRAILQRVLETCLSFAGAP